MVIQVRINGMEGGMKTIDLCDTPEQMKTMTVLQLKKKLMEKIPGNVDPSEIRLIFTTKQLQDEDKLITYGIQHQSVIQFVLRVHGGYK